MTEFTFLLLGIGLIVVFRWVVLLSCAEIGRKKDLIKHIYRHETAYRVSVLIPFLDGTQSPALMALLGALNQQDYPKAHMKVHIVTTKEHALGLPQPEQLPAFVKVWSHPEEAHQSHHPMSGYYISWLIERLLAAGGPTSLFVFLDPTDIVRSDFLKNITTRASESSVFQGYLALKRPMKGLFGLVYSLSLRLANRIENAGGFHFGLSCKLLSSGWVIRQELLEMLPYHKGIDVDNLEYTMRLTEHGYPIQWAPNVVVYKDDKLTLGKVLQPMPFILFNRCRLLLQKFFPALFKGLIKVNFSLVDQAWLLIQPSTGLVGIVAVVGLLASVMLPSYQYAMDWWAAFVAIYLISQIVGLAVARVKFQDMVLSLLATPTIYGLVTFLFPVYFVQTAIGLIFKPLGSSSHSKIRTKAVGKRLNESLDAKPLPTSTAPASSKPSSSRPSSAEQRVDQFETIDMSQANAASDSSSLAGSQAGSSNGETQLAPMADLKNNVQDESIVFEESEPMGVSKGSHIVEGLLFKQGVEQADGAVHYRAAFEYKGLSFKTQLHESLELAIDALTKRLAKKGFTVVSDHGTDVSVAEPIPAELSS